ncbi:MAG: helix-turn-helix domain-containing protein [Prevotella sp.]|jgi:excisionase family DNA binding protein|nr:helix-turn-helix domain-containing protein [Prevotella sp.]
MNQDEITFDRLPEAVAYLIKEVSQLRKLMEEKQKPTIPKRTLIGIDEACEIIKKAKPTVYTLVRKGLLPCYKHGKKLYFYEDELLEWIAKGKRKTVGEIILLTPREKNKL